MVQVGPDDGQRNQLDDPAGNEAAAFRSTALKLANENSDDSEASNIQMMNGSSKNMIALDAVEDSKQCLLGVSDWFNVVKNVDLRDSGHFFFASSVMAGYFVDVTAL